MITKKRLVLGAAIISSVAALASCGKTTTAKELRIVDKCTSAKGLCEFELTDAVVSRYTNILGKTIERVESKTPLHDIQGTITWNAPATASLADNATVKSTLGVSCQGDSCTANSNPTAYNLPVGSNTISVSGTVTVDGKTIDLDTDVQPVVVDTKKLNNRYVFDTGTLPSGASIPTLVNALNEVNTYAHGEFSDGTGNTLIIDCDDGYGWLDDVKPKYGDKLPTPANGASYVEFNVKDAKFQNKEALKDGESTFTQNGAPSGDVLYWQAGCWKK
ncbi:DUF3281 family protein [Francisella hispaniensis]|uniref:DUF3281 domain-containing protein n=1 Tax=Francisella hispaniensis FSC454 TaxID=1088883 RepID=A0AAC9J8L0_9GAMM|nr:DUF3281 family protein [Francisella hispaniensis]APD51306.1 hypothetical protein FSC454_06265 [Francisella hispaniensis FSC454]KYW85243.1 hypothetical protein AUF42_04775 [Francisella hispaniensis FSC454]